MESRCACWIARTQRELLQLPGWPDLQVRADGRFLVSTGKQINLVELASGREYRSITCQPNVGKDFVYGHPYVHPAGRLLAVETADGTRLFDLQTGDELAWLWPGGGIFAANGALLTANGNDAVLCWPIQHESDPNRLQVGPPEVLQYGIFIDMACDKNARVIGLGALDGAYVVRPGKRTVRLRPHADARHIAISPDGRYAATGNHGGMGGVKIWNTETGELVARFAVGSGCYPLFSPDGKWLAGSGSAGSFLVKLDTWVQCTTANSQRGDFFSPDGSFLVNTPGPGVFRLQNPDTGEETVRLEDPHNEGDIGSAAITPDGSKLVCSQDKSRVIRVWDLRMIREELDALGLDWKAPPFPIVEQLPIAPLEVKVDCGPYFLPRTALGLYSLRLALNPFDCEAYVERAKAHSRLGQSREAFADYNTSLVLAPADHKCRGERCFAELSSTGG